MLRVAKNWIVNGNRYVKIIIYFGILKMMFRIDSETTLWKQNILSLASPKMLDIWWQMSP